MFHSYLTQLFASRFLSKRKIARTMVFATCSLSLAHCSKDKGSASAVESRVPSAPAIKNNVAASNLPASLDTQAEFASQFTTSLETILGATQSYSQALSEGTSAPVTETVSGAMSSSINLSNGLKELAKNHADAGCTNSLSLLRDALPLSKSIQKSKNAISKDAMLKNQKFLEVTENPLADSQAANLSFLLTPEFRVKSASNLSGVSISGSDGNTYYSSGQTDFDIDFAKFFQALISSSIGSDSSPSTEKESSKIRGSSKELFTVVKDTKILKYIEQSSAVIKVTAGDKTVDGTGSGYQSFELNGLTGIFTSQKEGSMEGNGKTTNTKQTAEIKKIDDTSLSISFTWTIAQDGSNKSSSTVATLKRNDDKSCTATFNPEFDSAKFEELDGSNVESQ